MTVRVDDAQGFDTNASCHHKKSRGRHPKCALLYPFNVVLFYFHEFRDFAYGGISEFRLEARYFRVFFLFF